MTQEMMKTAMFVCTGVMFTTALIAGVGAWAATNAWLTNRREARAAQEERSEKRKEQERATWAAMVADRDEQIASLKDQLSRMQTLSDISDKLLSESEDLRIRMDATEERAGKLTEKLMRAWHERDLAEYERQKAVAQYGDAMDRAEAAEYRAEKAEKHLRKAEAQA